MPALKNDRVIRALLRRPADTTPIWIMRQAGRYLPEYRKVRESAKDFLKLCKTPELAAEVTLQPVRRYPLDAAIVFSDILLIPEAMGLKLKFTDNAGPSFERAITSEAQINSLHEPITEKDMPWLLQSIAWVRRELDGKVPLIGFAGSPWTLAVYMIEGGVSRGFRKIKTLMYQRPDLLKVLLNKLTSAVTECLNSQIKAGAQCVMLFDSWGGILPTTHYLDFSLTPMKKIVAGLVREYRNSRVPCILFTKGGGGWLEAMANSGCDALNLDWTTSIGTARKRVGRRVALQGNLDPDVLTAPDHVVAAEARKIVHDFGEHPGHVFNLGHGIHPSTHPEKVSILVEAVHEAGRKKTPQPSPL